MSTIVKIAEVYDVNPTDAISASDDDLFTFAPMESVDEQTASIAQRYVRPYKEVSRGYTPFSERDVLIAKITPCMENGKCAIAKGLHGGRGFGSTEFHVLRAKKNVIPEWLYYFWRRPEPRAAAARSMTGTAGQKRVPESVFEDMEIPLPDLPTQRRIATTLDRADRLRRVRRFALEYGQGFAFTIFRERFGPRLKSGTHRELGELVKITGGGTPARDHPEYFTGDVPWLTSKDMKSDYIWETEEYITEDAIKNSATNLVPVDSVIVVVKSKVLMHRLPVAIAKVPLCHGQDIKSIQCSDEIEPEFLRFLLKFHEPRLLGIARGANTEGLTLPMLQELPVPDVKPDEQRKFVALIERYEKGRAVHRESLRQADHLFQSLLHRAFTEGVN